MIADESSSCQDPFLKCCPTRLIPQKKSHTQTELDSVFSVDSPEQAASDLKCSAKFKAHFVVWERNGGKKQTISL